VARLLITWRRSRHAGLALSVRQEFDCSDRLRREYAWWIERANPLRASLSGRPAMPASYTVAAAPPRDPYPSERSE